MRGNTVASTRLRTRTNTLPKPPRPTSSTLMKRERTIAPGSRVTIRRSSNCSTASTTAADALHLAPGVANHVPVQRLLHVVIHLAIAPTQGARELVHGQPPPLVTRVFGNVDHLAGRN